MLKRAVFLLGAVGIVVIATACSDDDDSYGYASGGYGGTNVVCGNYKTCGTCTPVVGCGWCATGNGTGTCADGPDNCSTSPAGWSWNPDECSGASSDGGESTTSEGGRTSANPTVGDEAGSTSIDDAGSSDSSSVTPSGNGSGDGGAD